MNEKLEEVLPTQHTNFLKPCASNYPGNFHIATFDQSKIHPARYRF